MEAYVDERKRPSWVPKTAVTWGYRIVTGHGRYSPVPIDCRGLGCRGVFGSIKQYPVGRVVESDFCNCSNECCKGLGFFLTRADAVSFQKNRGRTEFMKGTVIVRCYVPRGGKWKRIKSALYNSKKCRANKLVTL